MTSIIHIDSYPPDYLNTKSRIASCFCVSLFACFVRAASRISHSIGRVIRLMRHSDTQNDRNKYITNTDRTNTTQIIVKKSSFVFCCPPPMSPPNRLIAMLAGYLTDSNGGWVVVARCAGLARQQVPDVHDMHSRSAHSECDMMAGMFIHMLVFMQRNTRVINVCWPVQTNTHTLEPGT